MVVGSKVMFWSASKQLCIYDRQSWKVDTRWELKKDAKVVSFSPEGKTIAVGYGNQTVCIYTTAFTRSNVFDGITLPGPRNIIIVNIIIISIIFRKIKISKTEN